MAEATQKEAEKKPLPGSPEARESGHRVARLLSDHIDELERKDALLGDVFAGAERGHRG